MNCMCTSVSNAGSTGKFFHACESFMGYEQYPPNWIAFEDVIFLDFSVKHLLSRLDLVL